MLKALKKVMFFQVPKITIVNFDKIVFDLKFNSFHRILWYQVVLVFLWVNLN